VIIVKIYYVIISIRVERGRKTEKERKGYNNNNNNSTNMMSERMKTNPQTTSNMYLTLNRMDVRQNKR